MPMEAGPSRPATQHDELPHELIMSIERVLDIQGQAEKDPLDALTNSFDAVNVLNGYFPNGVHAMS